MSLPIEHVSLPRRARLVRGRRRGATGPYSTLYPSSSQTVNPGLDRPTLQSQSRNTDHIKESDLVTDFEYDGELFAPTPREADPSRVVIYEAWTPSLLKAIDRSAADIYGDLNSSRDPQCRAWQTAMRWYCRDLIGLIEQEIERATDVNAGDVSDDELADAGVDPDVLRAWNHALACLRGIVAQAGHSRIDTTWIAPIFTPKLFSMEVKLGTRFRGQFPKLSPG